MLHTTLDAATKDKDDAHPERPERISGIYNKLKRGCHRNRSLSSADPSLAVVGLTHRMKQITVREVVREEVMLIHSEGHWLRVRATGCALSSPLPFFR